MKIVDLTVELYFKGKTVNSQFFPILPELNDFSIKQQERINSSNAIKFEHNVVMRSGFVTIWKVPWENDIIRRIDRPQFVRSVSALYLVPCSFSVVSQLGFLRIFGRLWALIQS